MAKIMKLLSFSSCITVAFIAYVTYSLWTLAQIFWPPECNKADKCFSSYLATNPVQHLVLYTSVRPLPYTDGSTREDVEKVHTTLNFDYKKISSLDVTIKLPRKCRNNGTLYMHVALLDRDSIYKEFSELRRTENFYTFPLTKYTEPQLETFNLLQENKDKNIISDVKPFTHIATEVPLGVMTDDIKFPYSNIPGELYPYIRLRSGKYLPLIQQNELNSRLSHFKLVNSSMKELDIKVTVSPVSYGLLRLSIHIHMALKQLKEMGFSEKDVDDVKGIFADTNLILLSATILIASCHLLFDFLAFKNDVSFWHQKKSLAGLSGRTVLWRAFSQLVIFLYLLDEKTSLLVLVPSGICAIIEAWKVTKVLHLRVSFSHWRLRVWRETTSDAAERSTAVADAEAMRYLSLILYPLCVMGAVYSLIYQPHKSWYSWILRSVVNGVYAFGFLLMLPQLFVNYRLKSVAALPWRAFMYKAFNTFIDDVFAFIITMPTAHRMACFRDDIVFMIYLYQRWLYPVDESRTDTASSMDEVSEHIDIKDKKTK